MFLEGHEAGFEEIHVLEELLGLGAAEDIHEFLGQLEGSLFNIEAFAGCDGEDEAVVDVDDVAVGVDHDVLVVAVLDVEDVAGEGVAGQGAHEVVSGLLEAIGLPPALPEVVDVEIVERPPQRLLVDLVDGDAVVDHLDQPAAGPGRQDLVRLHPDRQLPQLEDLLHLHQQLHRELLLPHIVKCLHDKPEQPPRLQTPERGRLSHPLLLLLAGLLREPDLLPQRLPPLQRRLRQQILNIIFVLFVALSLHLVALDEVLEGPPSGVFFLFFVAFPHRGQTEVVGVRRVRILIFLLFLLDLLKVGHLALLELPLLRNQLAYLFAQLNLLRLHPLILPQLAPPLQVMELADDQGVAGSDVRHLPDFIDFLAGLPLFVGLFGLVDLFEEFLLDGPSEGVELRELELFALFGLFLVGDALFQAAKGHFRANLLLVVLSAAVDADLVGPEELHTHHEVGPLLRLEDPRLVRRQMQHAMVANGLIHEGHVDARREAFVDLHELLLEVQVLLLLAALHLAELLGDLRQRLDEDRRRIERRQVARHHEALSVLRPRNLLLRSHAERLQYYILRTDCEVLEPREALGIPVHHPLRLQDVVVLLVLLDLLQQVRRRRHLQHPPRNHLRIVILQPQLHIPLDEASRIC
mmetsp:Transcript_15279/g.14841  ORF Transcript_15279/g.14841 Transcript_15279/m.14841 type:complete len:636 (+) Transcript_15279:269-2176(+)